MLEKLQAKRAERVAELNKYVRHLDMAQGAIAQLDELIAAEIKEWDEADLAADAPDYGLDRASNPYWNNNVNCAEDWQHTLAPDAPADPNPECFTATEEVRRHHIEKRFMTPPAPHVMQPFCRDNDCDQEEGA